MRTVQIICHCKALVAVRDNRVEVHDTPEGEPCTNGSARYIPQRIGGGHPGRPGSELVAGGAVPCGNCGKDHGVMWGLYRRTGARAENN